MTLDTLAWFALFGGLALVLLAETLWPRHTWSFRHRVVHFLHNALLWLVVIATLSFVSSALWTPLMNASQTYELGLLPLFGAPAWLAATVGFLVADFSDYVLHRASHRFRPLWLLHAVHHSDRHLDATTSLRQHPLSYLFILSVRALVIVAIGAPLWVLALRDVFAIITSHLHHAGIAWSPRSIAWMDRYVSWLIVPPTAHWLHHDPREEFTNSNYGQLLSWWDRLFGTYQPSTIAASGSGLSAMADDAWHHVWGLLMTPWRARKLQRF
jgi:sterol desaturase/sphingolipid hydroxylase (fatty acid hydroxylase superfamily)